MKKTICSSEEESPALLHEEACFVVDDREVHPAQQGFVAVHNYALYFWRPYLGGTAFALWELLLSFCYGDKDTAHPSIARLSRMLSNGDHSRNVITGRKRAEHTARCEGALDILLRERVVQVLREGEGPLAHYTFRVCKALPLLRPEQVARLCAPLQSDHARWLRRYGIHEAAYRKAYDTEGAAPGTGTAAAGTGGAAPGTGGAAPGSTNHTQEAALWKQWWEKAKEELRYQLRSNTFLLGLSHTRAHSFDDGVLMVRPPTPVAADLLQHRLLPLVRRTLHEVSDGQVREVEIRDEK